MEDNIGEHYVSEICNLFRANGRDLHAGRLTLCLTATCVEYITRKSSILQIGSITTEQPQMQQWRSLPVFLESVKAVKMIEDHNVPLKSAVSLSPFKHINTLVLKRLPVNLVLGLQRLRQQLKILIVERCLNDIDDVLVFCGGDNANAFVWALLSDLNLSHNSISSLGDALKYLPAVQRVDLSDNQVSSDHNGVQYIDNASFLHLGFNRLVTLPPFGPRAKYNLTVLCLRNNNLDNLDGVEYLERLTELDAADNCIAEHKRLMVLATLHHLTNLHLNGNPISSDSYYRKEACTYLSSYLDPKKVKLDGSHLSTAECKLLAQRNVNTVTVVSPDQAMEQIFSMPIPGSGYITPEGDVESTTPIKRSPRMKRKKKKARKVNLSDSEDPLSSTGHTPKKDSPLKHYDRRKKQEQMRKELQSKWLTVANLEKHGTNSNVETAEEVEQRQVADQLVERSDEIIISTGSNVAPGTTTVEMERTDSDDPLLECYGRLEEEGSFLVRVYDSDTEEPSSMDRLYVCVSDRFLEERDFGSGKVIDKLDLNCLQSATVTDVHNSNHHTNFMMVLSFSYERRDRRKREYLMQNEAETQRLLGKLVPVIKKNKTEVAVNTKMECLECHSIIDSKHIIMKGSSDSDLPSSGIANPLKVGVTSPHFLERLCPFCQSSSIVEKTSLSGSVPTYSPSVWTDSVLVRTSPAYARSPTNSSASNKTPVMIHKSQKEYVVEISSCQQKEEDRVSSPEVSCVTIHEVQQVQGRNDDTSQVVTMECDKTLASQGEDHLQEVNARAVLEDGDETVLHEPSVQEPYLKCDEVPEISFETSFGSLPGEEHILPQNRISHNRSRSMDLPAKKLTPNRNPPSRHLSGMWPRGDDEPELSYAASLIEYATQKKLLKGSEASLDSSISGAATQSDSLAPVRSCTVSSSDSRSVTPTGVPFSLDDPQYLHNSFKLYLDMKVFDDHEEFRLLLRCSAVTFGHQQEFAGLILVTDEFLYVCQVVAPIASSPSKWLKFLHRHSLKLLEFIEYGLGYQSFTIEFSPPEKVWYKLCPQDQQRCQDFVTRLTGVLSDLNECKFKSIKTSLQSMINLQSQVFKVAMLSQEEIYGNWLSDTLKQTSDMIQDRQIYLKSYPQCFSGGDLVQWLTGREEHDSDVNVCVLCQRLLDAGAICSLNDERLFKPNDNLYRFAADHHKHSKKPPPDRSSFRKLSTLAEHEEVLELFLLGRWLKTGNLSQMTVAVVLSSSEIFLVQESLLWPLPRYAKLPPVDTILPQFTVLQQRKINEVHYLMLDCDQPQHVTIAFFAEDLADADVRTWLLIFETESNAKQLTKAIKVCWEAEFGIEFEIKKK